MSKIINIRILISLLIILVFVGFFALMLRLLSDPTQVRARLSDTVVAPGEVISFADSTRGAKSWLWEWGNSESTPSRTGEYSFETKGRYKVRLTVNGKLVKYFMVTVKDPDHVATDDFPQIVAPIEAVQGELVLFRATGEAAEWRWEFGETGMIDSREKYALYAFTIPGEYEVLLSTDKTKYPIRHTINVLGTYQLADTTDVLSIIGAEIRVKLQAIADGKPFNMNYNELLSRYMANKPQTMVVVNNSKENDIYSYCQGLKMTGRTNKTKIETVMVDMDATDQYVEKITVIQYDKP